MIQADCTIRGDLHRKSPPSSSTSSSSNTSKTGTGSKSQPQSQAQTHVAVFIGRYCFLSAHSVLRPPSKLHQPQTSSSQHQHQQSQQSSPQQQQQQSYYPLKIGDHVFIGQGAVIEAAVIGNYVRIGAGAVLGRFSIVKDFVRILDGCVVPPGMVLPGFSVVGGRPARVVAELKEGEMDDFDLRDLYRGVR